MMKHMHVGRGYCSASSEGSEGDCARGLIGTWLIGDLPQCIERCKQCAQCNFVSFSKRHRDCSWFAGCATKALGKLYGGDAFDTFRVKPARGRTRCPGAHRTKARMPAAPHAVSAGAAPAVGVHLVTFFSEGQPRDGGMPLGAVAGVLEAAFAPYVDSYRGYTPTGLYNSTLQWGDHPGVPGRAVVKPSRVSATMNTGLSAIGQLAAKPYAILLRILEIPHGDLLLYKDANVVKRPNLLAGAARVRETLAWTLQEAQPAQDVFIPFENTQLKLKHHCKSHAVRTMAPAERHHEIFESPIHHSCQLVARRTPAAEAFLWAWLQACPLTLP